MISLERSSTAIERGNFMDRLKHGRWCTIGRRGKYIVFRRRVSCPVKAFVVTVPVVLIIGVVLVNQFHHLSASQIVVGALIAASLLAGSLVSGVTIDTIVNLRTGGMRSVTFFWGFRIGGEVVLRDVSTVLFAPVRGRAIQGGVPSGYGVFLVSRKSAHQDLLFIFGRESDWSGFLTEVSEAAR